jgi:SAM-dependent methyltransferase
LIQSTLRTDYIRLETKGRKSGLVHIVELRYACADGSFYLLAGDRKSDWVLNALHGGQVKVRTDDAIYESSARIATVAERRMALEEFTKKYGKRVVNGWYKNSDTCLCLTPTGPPIARRVVRGELSVAKTYSQWAGSKPDYYNEVGTAFDLASEEYDFTISHNFINTWIRRRSVRILEEYLQPRDVLIEVGCGTGAEAIEISRKVSGILAVDVSQKMVDLVAAKVRAKHLTGKVIPLRLPAFEIYKASESLGGQKVRVAYSFNGALNCEPRLKEFVHGLDSLMQRSGYFICSVRNTICLSEMLSHALVFQFGRATPRKKQPAMVSVGGKDIPSTYYSVWRFAEFFKPYFRPVRIVGLPALLPPAYLNKYYLKLRGGLSVLEKLEILASQKFPLNLLGDQTLFVFQKVAT